MTALPAHTGSDWLNAPGRRFCLGAAFVAAVALAASRLSGLWMAFDMLSHFTVHFILIIAACLAGMMMPRWRMLTSAALVLAGVIAIGNWPFTARPAVAAIPGTRNITIMSFNTLLSNTNWQAIGREIARQDPDIVTLLEFGPEKARVLPALKKKFPYSVDCHKIVFCHLAILSKFPFSHAKATVGWKGPPYIRARFGRELGNLMVFGVHTIRPPHYRAHARQIAALARAIARFKGIKVVMGDFNATPFSRMTGLFSQRTGLKRITAVPSWPAGIAGLPQIAIDHMFVSKGIKVAAAPRRGAASGSDHYPLIATIAIQLKGTGK